MLTLSPAASEALAIVLRELEAAAIFRRGDVTVTLNACVELFGGKVSPTVTGAEFEGCRPSMVGMVDVEPNASGDGRTYANLNGEFLVSFPD